VLSNVVYNTTQSYGFAAALGSAVGAGLTSGTLTQYNYTSGPTAPGPTTGTNGVANFNSSSTPSTTVTVPTTDSAVVDSMSGPLSITGGAAGDTVVAGSGGLYYTNITPSGSKIDYITAGDGNNTIETSTTGTGNYAVNTGAGNDIISVNGNAVVNAGTGNNSISVSGGNSLIYSEGNDSIQGSTVVGAGGTDTVNVGSGQATVNPGTSNLFIFGTSTTTNPLVVLPGTGSDTISVGSGGGYVSAGTGGNSILYGGAGASNAPLVLRGGASGDQIFAVSSGKVTAYAGPGNETISGAASDANGFPQPGSTANNTFYAGTGNDTLIAGLGNDTLIGGTGTALMVSSTQGATTFEFQFGNTVGQDTITGFKATDTLDLSGFGTTPVNETVSGGSTVISLFDGTQITISGVTNLNPNQITKT
jgi:serralysin